MVFFIKQIDRFLTTARLVFINFIVVRGIMLVRIITVEVVSNMRLTKKRETILNILKQTDKPLSAEDIYKELGDASINLSTIYRALELFYTQRMVLKSVFDNRAFYHINKHVHSHYMICENCGTMQAFNCHMDHLIHHIEDDHHFKVTHHDLTFYGLCEACQNSLSSKY